MFVINSCLNSIGTGIIHMIMTHFGHWRRVTAPHTRRINHSDLRWIRARYEC